MRLLIVTGRQQRHQYLCAELASRWPVVGIIHPGQSTKRTTFEAARRRLATFGTGLTVLHYLTRAPIPLTGWKAERERREAERKLFPQAEKKYAALAIPQISTADINSSDSIERIRSLAPDVTICLGGPIYKQSFIEAAGIVLNYHSGISPIYNGADSVAFAFANGQPQLSGGTLMVMNDRIDGGDVLGHYLTPIAAGDTPATLFAKGIVGAVESYERFLTHFAKCGIFQQVPQPPPFLYYRSGEFTLHHALSIERHLRRGICERYVRPKRVVSYWDKANRLEARTAMAEFLKELLSSRGGCGKRRKGVVREAAH